MRNYIRYCLFNESASGMLRSFGTKMSQGNPETEYSDGEYTEISMQLIDYDIANVVS